MTSSHWPSQATLRSETTYAMPEARSVTSGVTGDRKWTPRISAIRATVASVTQGSPSSISRHSSIRAGTAPVIPTSWSSGKRTYFSANLAVSSSWSSRSTLGSKKR